VKSTGFLSAASVAMTVIVVIIRGGDLGGSRVSGMVTSTEAATGMTVRAPTPSRN
jgi:hypothetical protein